MNAFEKRIQGSINKEKKDYYFLLKRSDYNGDRPSYLVNRLHVCTSASGNRLLTYNYKVLIFIKNNMKHIKNYKYIAEFLVFHKNNPRRYGNVKSYQKDTFDLHLPEICMKFYKHHPIEYLQWFHTHITDKTNRFICKNHLSTYLELYKFIINSKSLKTLKEKQDMIDCTAKLLFEAKVIDENLKDLCYNVKDDEQFERYIGKFIFELNNMVNINQICTHIKKRYSKILLSDDIVSKLGQSISHGKIVWKQKNDKSWFCEYSE